MVLAVAVAVVVALLVVVLTHESTHINNLGNTNGIRSVGSEVGELQWRDNSFLTPSAHQTSSVDAGTV